MDQGRHDTLASVVALAHALASGAVTGGDVPRLLRDLAAAIESGVVLKQPAQLASGAQTTLEGAGLALNVKTKVFSLAESSALTLAQSIQLVFDYWKAATRHSTARLLPERAAHIRARLKDFTPADLCDAVDGCLLSDFHGGQNDRGEKYDWIENIMRNGSVVEKHMARARAGRGGNGALRDMNSDTIKLRAQLDRAMEVGDVTTANEINRKLAAALRKSAGADGSPDSR